jgi:hypothetical protein
MKFDVMVLVTTRMQFSTRIKKVHRSSFSKTCVKTSLVGNPN